MKARKVQLEDGTLVGVKSVRSRRCGKLAYSSRKIAKAKAREQSRATGETIVEYHCYACHCHHIGHPPGSRPRPDTPPLDAAAPGHP